MSIKVLMSPHCFEKDLDYFRYLQEWILEHEPEVQWIDLESLENQLDSHPPISDETRIAETPRETLVILGGDGTLHRVLNILGIERLQQYDLMVIPAGTGNDFARSLDIPLDPLKAVSLMFNYPKRIRVDLGMVNEEILFSCALSIGFGVEVTKFATRRIRKHVGRTALVWGAIRYLFNRSKPVHKLKLYYRGKKRSVSALQLVVGNAKTHGGGVPIGPNADLQSGVLDAYRIKPLTFWEYPYLIAKTMLGQDHRSYRKKVASFQARDLAIELQKETEVDIDGELYTLGPGTVSLQTLSGFLSIIVPDREAEALAHADHHVHRANPA